MVCYRPLKGYRSATPGPTGKHRVLFNPRGADVDRPVTLPCGQCTGCRLDRSRDWALRCMHEAKLYGDNNCFITLTFNDANLPLDGSLNHDHWVLFMKRLKSYCRRKFGKSVADGIRFYMCGEYGPKLGRPHYHACLFNFDFPDKVYKRVNAIGDRIFTSEILDNCWGQADPGMCEIGSVTFRSAGYVARYIMDKQTGADAVAYYGDKVPEYTNMSRRPGIGYGWFQRFKSDVFPANEVIHDGICHPVPRFYANIYESEGFDIPSRISREQKKSKLGGFYVKADNSSRRLDDRLKVKNAQIALLKKDKQL